MGKEAGECGLVCLGKKEDKQRVGGQTLTLSSVRITALVSSTSWAQDQLPGFKSAETFFGSFCDFLGVLKTHGVRVSHSGEKTAPSKHLVAGSHDSLYSNSIFTCMESSLVQVLLSLFF